MRRRVVHKAVIIFLIYMIVYFFSVGEVIIKRASISNWDMHLLAISKFYLKPILYGVLLGSWVVLIKNKTSKEMLWELAMVAIVFLLNSVVFNQSDTVWFTYFREMSGCLLGTEIIKVGYHYRKGTFTEEVRKK